MHVEDVVHRDDVTGKNLRKTYTRARTKPRTNCEDSVGDPLRPTCAAVEVELLANSGGPRRLRVTGHF